MNKSDIPKEPRKVGEGHWQMWAVVVPSPPYAQPFYEPGHKSYSNAYAASGEFVVPVDVRENEKGPYYGWIADGEAIPIMIHPTQSLFRMCFAYGPEKEVERGKGKIVRLSIEQYDPPKAILAEEHTAASTWIEE